MKSTLFIGATLVASSMAYSMKEATRIRRNLPAFTPPSMISGQSSDKCTFMSLNDLFPTNMLAITAKDGSSTIQDGNNYYGGWTKTVTVPETKAYQYYVTRSDVVVINDDGTAGGWNAIKDDQTKTYEINLCDNDDCNTYTGVPSTTGLQLFDSTDTFEGFDTIVQVIEEMDPDKQPMGDDLINKLHGSFTCGTSHDSTFVATGNLICTFYMPQKTWYFGVSSLCHHTTTASEANIFAWYVQPEPEQKFELYQKGADMGGGTGVTIPAIVENADSETDSPAEILFSAPVQGPQTLSLPGVWGVEQVSWIVKVDSTVTYTYSNQQTGSTAPPTRCSVNSGVSLGVVKDDENGNLVEEFSSNCKVSMEASIDVEFSDKYDDSLCDADGDATISGRQQAQIETTLVQFARIHENRTLPSLQNNTANRFFAAYNRAGQFDPDSGLPSADLSGPTTGDQSDWACLDGDDCDVGDPFIVLGHRKVTVLKANTINDASQSVNDAATLKKSLSYTISANIDAATLSSPNTAMSTPAGTVGALTPWSYVMGITDYTISECGAKNFDNKETFDGEYPTTTGTTTTARRLGSAMPKSVIRKSVINFGSYKGFE